MSYKTYNHKIFGHYFHKSKTVLRLYTALFFSKKNNETVVVEKNKNKILNKRWDVIDYHYEKCTDKS